MPQSAAFWDNIANKYAKSPISNPEAYQYTLERTRSYLSPSDKVLEVGCGTGSTALLLADDVEQIVASDISTGMINIAKGKAAEQAITNVDFIAADLTGKSIPQGPYDAILAFNFLHLLDDPSGTIRYLNGLLKPGGIFVSKTPCRPVKGTSLKFWLLSTALPLLQWLGKAPYVNFMAGDELEGLVTTESFIILEQGDHPPPSRYIVAKKNPA